MSQLEHNWSKLERASPLKVRFLLQCSSCSSPLKGQATGVEQRTRPKFPSEKGNAAGKAGGCMQTKQTLALAFADLRNLCQRRYEKMDPVCLEADCRKVQTDARNVP
jgi:hypothetical protein